MKLKKYLLILITFIFTIFLFSNFSTVNAMTATELKNKFDWVQNNVAVLKNGAKYTGSYRGLAWSCYGFANEVAENVFGSSHYTNSGDWQWYNNLNDLCIGDVIEYYEPASSSGTHCFIVTNLDGQNIEVTDSNGLGDYVNRWHKGWTNVYDLTKPGYGIQAVWHHKGSHVKKFDEDKTPPTISNPEIVLSSITATSFKIRAKVTDASGIKQVGINVWAKDNDMKWLLLTKNGDYYEKTLYASDFKNAKGLYAVHLYAKDNVGNESSYAFNQFCMGSTINKSLGNFTARITYKNNSNYVIGTEGQSDSASAVLKTKSTTDNSQLWQFTKQSDNTYEIKHVMSGKVLDVSGGNDADGTKVGLWTDKDSDNQRFYVMNYNGGYRIVPKCSAMFKSLDLNGAKVSNDNIIQLWEANSETQAAQTWTFEKGTVYTKTANGVQYRSYVQNKAWQGYVTNGTQSGTTGSSLRMEAIQIGLTGDEYSGGIEYRTHIQNKGWETSWKSNYATSGTTGQALRLEAIQIRLTGDIAKYYDVYYRVHSQCYGWLGWTKNGESAGTQGFGYRVESIQIKLVKKGGAAPGTTANCFVINEPNKGISYSTHVQNIGWQGYKSNGDISGTTGKGLRLEGIKINLDNFKLGNTSGGIQYRTHIQNIGWQNYVSNNALSGTTGKALRLEAIQIKLTGNLANKYDIYYRVHSQKFGWLGWAKNGESAGTSGLGYRLEGIQIRLVEKGKSAPGSTANAYRNK